MVVLPERRRGGGGGEKRARSGRRKTGDKGNQITKSGERHFIILSNYYYSEVNDKNNNHTLPLHDSTNEAIDVKTSEYEENSSQSGYS